MKIKISINRNWSATDFGNFYQALQRIYSFLLISEEHKQILRQEAFKRCTILIDQERYDPRYRKSFSYMLGKLSAMLEYSKSPEELYKYLNYEFDEHRHLSNYRYHGEWESKDTFLLNELNTLIQTFHPTPTYFMGNRVNGSLESFLERLLVVVESNLSYDQRLNVSSVKFSSPGFTDLTGIGEIIGHVKDIIIKLIETCESRKERKLKNRILENEIAEGELKIIGQKIELLKKVGYSDAECRQIINGTIPSFVTIENAADKGQIVNVEIVED